MTDIINNNTTREASISPQPLATTSSTLPGTGIANLPNQRHKIVAKNGANFTIMVCGKL
jgi:cell division control protein 12